MDNETTIGFEGAIMLDFADFGKPVYGTFSWNKPVKDGVKKDDKTLYYIIMGVMGFIIMVLLLLLVVVSASKGKKKV